MHWEASIASALHFPELERIDLPPLGNADGTPAQICQANVRLADPGDEQLLNACTTFPGNEHAIRGPLAVLRAGQAVGYPGGGISPPTSGAASVRGTTGGHVCISPPPAAGGV